MKTRKKILIAHIDSKRDWFEFMRTHESFMSGFVNEKITDIGKMRRWDIWRPSVALAWQKNIHFDEYHLILDSASRGIIPHADPQGRLSLAKIIESDIKTISPSTAVFLHILAIHPAKKDDIATVYQSLRKLIVDKIKIVANVDYYTNCQSGPDAIKTSLLILSQSGIIPGVRIKVYPEPHSSPANPNFDSQDLEIDIPSTGIYTPQGRYEIEDPAIFRSVLTDAKAKESQLSIIRGGIDTKNKAYNELTEEICSIAIRTKEPILLTGPTGCGKTEMVNRIMKARATTTQGTPKLISINCAALRGDLVNSLLFGYKRGAYTGAEQDSDGYLKQADGGTLFLDEIGTLPLDTQAILLKAIEEKKFRPLNSQKDETSAFQLICGTNEDLEAAVVDRRFRLDLLERINTWSFALPGLKDRREDIPANIKYELKSLSQEMELHVFFTPDAEQCFLDYALDPTTLWRGNFREFKKIFRRMATLSDSGCITYEIAKREIIRNRTRGLSSPAAQPQIAEDYHVREMSRFDRVQLADVIQVCKESAKLSEAARKLFGDDPKYKSNPSSRLIKYLQRAGLSFNKLKSTME